jgi:hypothetical protein
MDLLIKHANIPVSMIRKKGSPDPDVEGGMEGPEGRSPPPSVSSLALPQSITQLYASVLRRLL